jgi:hypothetical protein
LASLNVSIELIKSSAVGDKATVLRNFRGLKHRRQTQSRNPFHDGLPALNMSGAAKTLSAAAPELFAISIAPMISSGLAT